MDDSIDVDALARKDIDPNGWRRCTIEEFEKEDCISQVLVDEPMFEKGVDQLAVDNAYAYVVEPDAANPLHGTGSILRAYPLDRATPPVRHDFGAPIRIAAVGGRLFVKKRGEMRVFDPKTATTSPFMAISKDATLWPYGIVSNEQGIAWLESQAKGSARRVLFRGWKQQTIEVVGQSSTWTAKLAALDDSFILWDNGSARVITVGGKHPQLGPAKTVTKKTPPVSTEFSCAATYCGVAEWPCNALFSGTPCPFDGTIASWNRTSNALTQLVHSTGPDWIYAMPTPAMIVSFDRLEGVRAVSVTSGGVRHLARHACEAAISERVIVYQAADHDGGPCGSKLKVMALPPGLP